MARTYRVGHSGSDVAEQPPAEQPPPQEPVAETAVEEVPDITGEPAEA